jgi:hypothetical protein
MEQESILGDSGPPRTSRALGEWFGYRVGQFDRCVLPAKWRQRDHLRRPDRTDLPYEYQLAAMNEALGVTTLLMPAQSELAATSSTILRKLGA